MTSYVCIQEQDRKFKIYNCNRQGTPSTLAINYTYDMYEYAEFACNQRGWEIVKEDGGFNQLETGKPFGGAD